MSHKPKNPTTRREALRKVGNGFGMMAFASMVSESIARAGGDKLIGVMPYYNAADYMGRATAYGIVGRKDRGIDAANPAVTEMLARHAATLDLLGTA